MVELQKTGRSAQNVQNKLLRHVQSLRPPVFRSRLEGRPEPQEIKGRHTLSLGPNKMEAIRYNGSTKPSDLGKVAPGMLTLDQVMLPGETPLKTWG